MMLSEATSVQPLGPEADAASAAPTPAARRRARRRLRRWLVRGGLAAVLLLVLSAAAAFVLARTPPSWWQAIDPNDKAIIAAAQRVENGAATQLTRIRKAEPGAGSGGGVAGQDSRPWTIKLTAADANAWLAARLRPWLESQEGVRFKWPADLERVEVGFDGGRINLGAALRKPYTGTGGPASDSGRAEILTASLHPEFRTDGGLWLPARSVSIGRLSLPPSWLIRPPASAKPAGASPPASARALPASISDLPQTKDLLAALADERPAMAAPVIKIGDGRRVRILRLDPRDGALYITCQTLASEPGGSPTATATPP